MAWPALLRVIKAAHCGLAGPAPRPVWEHTEAPMRLLRLKISLDRPRRPRKRPPTGADLWQCTPPPQTATNKNRF